MAVQMVFPNFAVNDLEIATNFYESLGFQRNPLYSDGTNANAVVLSEGVGVMLLTKDYFAGFFDDGTTITTEHREGTLAMLLESIDEVDAMLSKVEAAGGTIDSRPKEDDFMYQARFRDPDGHILEIFFMEPFTEADVEQSQPAS
ncbi:VOC family protein [Humidisolicoccus flavus]|uniref:VOC family protein n=1 Tax=Humidisolicoccus flavus TaxID=3111414 RepID=UPI00325316A0